LQELNGENVTDGFPADCMENLTEIIMADMTSSNQSGEHGHERKSIRMDMTPMVDLAFLLLTFFILTTTLNEPYVMLMHMPDEPEQAQSLPPLSAKRVLNLVLGKDNVVYWYRGLENPEVQKTDFESLRTLLFEQKKKIDRMVVLIKPSPQSHYKNLIDALDEMSITDIKDFYIMKVTDADRDIIPALN
jgi:biopolymer transport protein ExbD